MFQPKSAIFGRSGGMEKPARMGIVDAGEEDGVPGSELMGTFPGGYGRAKDVLSPC